MHLIYNIAIFFYGQAIRIAAFFSTKAAKWVEGRKNWKKQLENFPFQNAIWIHCASLGEFEQARPLIERIKSEGNQAVIVTFFSPSGYEAKKNYPLADWVGYLPLDTPLNAKFFVNKTIPKIAIFVKNEFWGNYFLQLKQQKIPLYIISAVFKKRQLFFKFYGGFFRQILHIPEKIFCQDKQSVKLVQTIGIHPVLSGDTRFDTVLNNTKHTTTFKEIEKFTANAQVLILGSSWPHEEKLLYSIYGEITTKHPDLKIIIAPHDISGERLKEIERLFPTDIGRYTQNDFGKKILLLDTIGMLSTVYRYTHIAFIGGGYTNKLHNILEPAAFGNVVLFGPETHDFWEAEAMKNEGAAFSIPNSDELFVVLNGLLSNESLRESFSDRNKRFVLKNSGATEKIYTEIFQSSTPNYIL